MLYSRAMPEKNRYYRLWVRFSGEKDWHLIGEYEYLMDVELAAKTLLHPAHDFLISDVRIEPAIEVEPTPEERKAIEEGRKSGEFIDLDEALKEIKRKERRKKGRRGKR
mgnify:CR=1 FL=1